MAKSPTPNLEAEKTGNYGHAAFSMIRKAVKVIRKDVNLKVLVVVRMDGGFFDRNRFDG